VLEVLLDFTFLEPALVEHVGLALPLAEDGSEAEEGDEEDVLDDEQNRDELHFVLFGWR
jgi:hypothetical protein